MVPDKMNEIKTAGATVKRYINVHSCNDTVHRKVYGFLECYIAHDIHKLQNEWIQPP